MQVATAICRVCRNPRILWNSQVSEIHPTCLTQKCSQEDCFDTKIKGICKSCGDPLSLCFTHASKTLSHCQDCEDLFNARLGRWHQKNQEEKVERVWFNNEIGCSFPFMHVLNIIEERGIQTVECLDDIEIVNKYWSKLKDAEKKELSHVRQKMVNFVNSPCDKKFSVPWKINQPGNEIFTCEYDGINEDTVCWFEGSELTNPGDQEEQEDEKSK